MGMDIHMNIVDKDGNYIEKDIYEGRNSDWFSNLRGDGWDDEYDHLPSYMGIPEKSPEDMREKFDKPASGGYFGFYYMTVKAFKNWFDSYRPDLKAGWATTYDKWRIEKKHYVPAELPIYVPEDATDKEHMHFVEYIDYYENSRWLYKHLKEGNIPNDAYITYYFDW